MEVLLAGKSRRFMVDYGMFQGGREATNKNLEPLPLSPKELEFVVLTHAHIDHSGLLPRLCAQGFSGPIYCTKATPELEQAERRQKAGKWRGDLPVALSSKEEVEMTLTQFQPTIKKLS
ncbi:MBL fold metallo-hydrolase [Polynucleobacter necessarius]|uniref:MBL fold metallo-hydrolase n=1 Tax=Polynucleobacter necessarius TaxID=576610 RepID=UPI0039E24BC4